VKATEIALSDEALGRPDEVADPPRFSAHAENVGMFSLEPWPNPLYVAVQQMVGSGSFGTIRSRTSRDIPSGSGFILMATTNRADTPTAASIPSFSSFAKLPAFNAASFTQAFKLPGFDVTTVLDIQRRNVEALTAANQTVVQGLQTVVRRQGEIARQSVKQVQDLLSVKPSSASITETLVKRIDLAKTSYEKNVADARELGDIVVKVGSEAGDILSRRVVASLDEVKVAARPKAAVLDEVKATAQRKAAGRVAIVA
jgi:phasin family protein